MGSVDVDVFRRPSAAGGTNGVHVLRLQVADTGPGVPPEDRKTLFTPYGQVSRYRFGTGLGLYHVREVVAALGGKTGYEPNEPAGAIFWADVPVKFVHPMPTTDEEAGGAPAALTPGARTAQCSARACLPCAP